VGHESYRVERSSTGELEPGERADFWSEHVTAYQGCLDYRYHHAENFHGSTVRQVTGSYQLVEFRSDQITYARTPRQIRQAPDEDYRFLLPISGRLTMRRDGEELMLLPGVGGLLTMDAPSVLQQEDHVRGYILTIPAHEVNGPLNRTSSVIAGLDLSRGLGRVVSDMLISLTIERDSLLGSEFNAVCDRIAELLCMLAAGDDRPTAPGHLAQVEALVRRYVREHAEDRDLGGAAMAQDLGWSLRQIQLALQHAGTTPRDLIREERLRLVRDRLRSSAYDHLSITDLARMCGFSSVSALSTAFRRRYGVSPREVRHERGD
jgi:AraC-like DNA-binding protein